MANTHQKIYLPLRCSMHIGRGHLQHFRDSKETPCSYNVHHTHKSLYSSLSDSYPGNCPTTGKVTKKHNTLVAEQTAAFYLVSFIPPLLSNHHNDQFENDTMQRWVFFLSPSGTSALQQQLGLSLFIRSGATQCLHFPSSPTPFLLSATTYLLLVFQHVSESRCPH